MAEPDLAELAEARVGHVLNDKWTLEKLLGVGGMAAVYAARHRNGARGAVKVLHTPLAQHANVRERFLHEGYAANRVEHPDVVKVLDDDTVEDGPDAGAAFLVMELLEGRSLEDRIHNGPPIGEVELLEILRGVLGVLEAAHSRGIIHRDLKPENLFLLAETEKDAPPHVKVLDFGIARTIESRGMTIAGAPMGTPAFMAPEQAAGRVDEIDGRTDLFSLGATAFNVLSGHLPHEGETTIDVMGKTANEQARSLREVAPKVSDSIVRIVDKALRLERGERYADAKAMLADVEAALEQLRGGKKRPEAPLPVIDRARDSAPPEQSSGCLSRILLVALIGACGVVAWFEGGKRMWDASRAPAASATTEPSLPGPLIPVPVMDATLDATAEEDSSTSQKDASTVEDASDDVAVLDQDATPAVAVSAKPVASHAPSAKPTPSSKPKPKPKHR